jgi:flagellum-specific peptidoglycan hydrolase FlgJ
MPLMPQQLSNLMTAGKMAKAAESSTVPPVPAILSICQWALESGWGMHQPNNNPFGIKAAVGAGGKPQMTEEFIDGEMKWLPQFFETFVTLQDAFARHNELLVNAHDGKGMYFYRGALLQYAKDMNLQSLFVGVARHYATDPNYASKLHTLSVMPEVQKAVA